MQKTMQALITAVETALYQSAGPSVQVYAQTPIMNMIQAAFDHCFMFTFWPQFRVRETRTLDGATGLPTVALAFITSWEDIQHVFRQNSDRPLAHIPSSYNTLNFGSNSAATARYIEPAASPNIFKVWPLTATDQITVVGRARPALEYALVDTVPFDHLALVHFAAWTYFTDDDSNPAAAEKHRGLFENRLKVLVDSAFGNSVELNTRSGYVPNQWSERP